MFTDLFWLLIELVFSIATVFAWMYFFISRPAVPRTLGVKMFWWWTFLASVISLGAAAEFLLRIRGETQYTDITPLSTWIMISMIGMFTTALLLGKHLGHKAQNRREAASKEAL